MKVAISQKTFAAMLSRGGASAISPVAVSDTSVYAPLLKSVKITASATEFTIESINRAFTVKYTLPSSKDNGIEVKEEGVAVVSAHELIEWVSKQNQSVIGLNLVKLEIPEVIAGKTKKDDDFHSNDVIRKIGNLKLVSKDNTKTGAKWSMDSYDSTQFPNMKQGADPATLFSITNKDLTNVINSIKFSIQEKDGEHILDCACIQAIDSAIYMATTDSLMCSLYKISPLVQDVGDYWKTPYNDKMGARVLIPLLILETINKTLDDKRVKFSYCKEKNYITIEQEGFYSRISIKESSIFSKFPNISSLILIKSKNLGTVPRGVFASRLSTTALVNKDMALFQFKDKELKIHVLSDSGKSPNTSTCPIENTEMEGKFIWGIQHLLSVLKAIKDSNINLLVTNNGAGFKIVSDSDPNAMYVGVTMSNSKYNGITLD